MNIAIECDYPLDFKTEYYSVECKTEKVYATCPICKGKKKVEINGEFFDCPKCAGGRSKNSLKVLKTRKRYYRKTWMLVSVNVTEFHYIANFEEIRSGKGWPERLEFRDEQIVQLRKSGFGEERQLTTDRTECDKKVRELNKVERERDE